MTKYAYPARSAGRSNAARPRRGRVNFDGVVGAFLIAIVVGGMFSLVAYANYRDSQHFRQEAVSSFPSRSQEAQGNG